MDSVTRDGRGWQPDFLIAIDRTTCIGCGRCFKVCGRHVMELKGVTDEDDLVDLATTEDDDDDDDDDDDAEFERKVMVLVDAGACIGCGACARVCPKKCQTHATRPPPL